VADEGVSAYPKAVTPQMVRNMLAGGRRERARRHAGAELEVVDIGVDDPLDGSAWPVPPARSGVARRISRKAAMSVDDAAAPSKPAFNSAGRRPCQRCPYAGHGENGYRQHDAPPAALFAAFLKCPVEVHHGRGTGIDDQRLQEKIAIGQAGARGDKSRLTSPLSTLAALGVTRSRGSAGSSSAAAAHRMPVVVDGFISTLAAGRRADAR